jgi:hypothetical protein
MENKDKSKQNEHDSGMFQVKEISKTNKNDGINLVLPVSGYHALTAGHY